MAAAASSSSASAIPANFNHMKLSAKKFLSLVLGLTALSLGAQNAATFGNLPLWFEAGAPAKFTGAGVSPAS